MEFPDQNISEMYRQKLALYQDLLGCLESERESLVSLDAEKLWDTMEIKEKIVNALEGVRVKFGALKNGGGFDSAAEDWKRVQELSTRTAVLEDEIKARVRENAAFIHETLDFFQDLVSLLIGGGKTDLSYDPRKRNERKALPQIYHAEV